jgi:hypothetical protein
MTLSITALCHYAECRVLFIVFAKCYYAECRSAEFRYTECRGAVAEGLS